METILKQKLDDITGKAYSYKGENISISKYKKTDSTVVIFINNRPRNFLFSEAEVFINSLEPPIDKPITDTLKKPSIPSSKKSLEIYEPTAENKEVKETLLETLKKVKTDPDFIPQAQAICNVVNQIVQVQKTEIQMLNFISNN